MIHLQSREGIGLVKHVQVVGDQDRDGTNAPRHELIVRHLDNWKSQKIITRNLIQCQTRIPIRLEEEHRTRLLTALKDPSHGALAQT